ncbi:50S ribosome-binding GTPase, partial [bacterium]|nr:50S ribosome-binding GTPase [bacterium]
MAIVGRPNVGKSTLFNRIIRKNEAIVDDRPGVTRDRKYAAAEWEGRPFTLVDTGGFIHKSENTIERGVTRQVLKAVEEADVVLFVTDCSTGVTAEDQDMAALLRKSKRPVLVVANKADNEKREIAAGEFHGFGMREVIPVSAVSGRGMGDMLSAVIRTLKAEESSAPEEAGGEPVRLAVIGRPNTGKSTFVNTLTGEERVLVHDIPGTTR